MAIRYNMYEKVKLVSVVVLKIVLWKRQLDGTVNKIKGPLAQRQITSYLTEYSRFSTITSQMSTSGLSSGMVKRDGC